MKYNTTILQPTDANIVRCASYLRMGELIAFPTETVYALGAAATNERAVKRVFEVKKRPADRPLIVAVAEKADIAGIVKRLPDRAKLLIDRFMPGALTLVLDRADIIPNAVTAGGDSVAVRIPDNEVARRLIRLARKPVVVPSANVSDKPSPTLAEHVKNDLNGEIRCILDGGSSKIGIESTVIDVRTDIPTVLREGGVPVSAIEKLLGDVTYKRSDNGGAFKPNAEVMFSAYYDGMTDGVKSRYDRLARDGRRAVILCLDGNRPRYGKRNCLAVGKNYDDYAKNLFAALRRADADKYDTVIAEGVKPDGIGEALAVKLIKLSGGLIV